MKLRFAKWVIIKVAVFLVFYFWDVALSSSVHTIKHQVLSIEHIQPAPFIISNELSDFDDFEDLESGISQLLRKFDIKGAGVAVAKDGKLVFAKGLGYADAEAGLPVEPGHMFRIASISKLITATTIMSMKEQGMLNLDDRVFGPEGILNDSVYLNYRDPRVENITVWHLLNHSSGWNRRFGDHMFMPHIISRATDAPLPVQVPDIIQFAMQRRLHFTPGSGTSYSNLGYAILGEIIEKISGRSYEQYVREEILYPVGIQEMRIGRNLETDRFENEVKYYEQTNAIKSSAFYDATRQVPLSYGGNDIETLGAAGGWIASPAELLKFVVAIDNKSGVPAILSDESIEMMTGIRGSGGQPIGWSATDKRDNWRRTGTFAGTSALVVRQGNGLSWAVFFNSSTYRGTSLSREIVREMQTALNKIENWPRHDLFYYFGARPYLYTDNTGLE